MMTLTPGRRGAARCKPRHSRGAGCRTSRNGDDEMKLSIIGAASLALCLAITAPAAQALDEPAADNPRVMLHTNHGDITLELYPREAPKTVANFIQYVNDGFYDGTIFHRVISYFMIQGGGLTADMKPKPTREPIINEADNGLKNERGTIAMARTNDVNSATAQFFINVEVNGSLDYTGKENSRTWGYAVFGKVVEGMDVVDDIRFVPTDENDVPKETVLIESAEILHGQ
jgi:peptidyl-prolyl cis-trans isomerase B (cyclophilin B)